VVEAEPVVEPEPVVAEEPVVEAEPVEEPEDVVLEVKPVETASAMDMLMAEDEDGEQDAPPALPH
jgi:fused signal recognition particle receptor